MHETSLIQQLLSMAEKSLAPYEVEKVNQLILKKGPLANVVDAALEFAFAALIKDSIFAGAEMIIEDLPIEAVCNQCQSNYQASVLPLCCPVCGSNLADIKSGTEIYLDSIDFEEKDSAEK
jgi:hydrogenase nickel incorporation protein HypA/HybF